MNYTKYIIITLLIPCFLQASKNPNTTDYRKALSNGTGLAFVGLLNSLEKVGKFPLGHFTKIVGTVPSFFLGKKAVEYTFDFYEYLKICQK